MGLCLAELKADILGVQSNGKGSDLSAERHLEVYEVVKALVWSQQGLSCSEQTHQRL